MSIGFYNVENLFDTLDDPDKDDDEFLPSAEREWNEERYADKVEKLSTVISKLGKTLPTIVGLCEVENKSVIEDLANANALKNGDYAIVHYESGDERGIDVGMLYRKKQFKVIYSKPIFVPLPETERPTRDILYVKGKVTKGPELHIFVNHWPSRWGGQEESEFKRLSAAKTLKAAIDSVIGTNPDALILCMGDFNDYPSNVSITEVLKADSLNTKSKMVNLMHGLQKQERGSYNYKGEWDFLDQIIVSRTLTDYKLPDIVSASTKPFFFDDMLYLNEEYGDIKTNRTYGGTKYFGGYSDHLPVYTILAY
ncbi:hypothetical protein G3O08_06615 [Cryomorpha ignava]|uniref:Endonuclease/exonuclease/phosphatase domain-containing protein n=1 Tax=Cryomorpha ignava TaxID=101383 RepID=A0A7K3WNE3_9FLAO|nr:hypothetical protein [Cryomorpha ignava]